MFDEHMMQPVIGLGHRAPLAPLASGEQETGHHVCVVDHMVAAGHGA